jgi:hypothetical protein
VHGLLEAMQQPSEKNQKYSEPLHTVRSLCRVKALVAGFYLLLYSCHNEAAAAHPMSMASPEIQKLARQLLAFEATRLNSSEAGVDAAVRVIEELRLRLTRLAGVDGFHSLLSRSLTLAKVESPCLNEVRVSANGSLGGFDAVEQSQEAMVQAGTILVAQLLALLVTFIGESLTLRLVRESWPEASMSEVESEVDLGIEEKP